MKDLIGAFDEILNKEQDRTLKKTVFRWTLCFFWAEIFFFLWLSIYLKPDQQFIQILIPATLLQISWMMYFIVRSLFWNGK
jgi:NhaP-type Na+/H+ and K+/H+ antiporter